MKLVNARLISQVGTSYCHCTPPSILCHHGLGESTTSTEGKSAKRAFEASARRCAFASSQMQIKTRQLLFVISNYITKSSNTNKAFLFKRSFSRAKRYRMPLTKTKRRFFMSTSGRGEKEDKDDLCRRRAATVQALHVPCLVHRDCLVDRDSLICVQDRPCTLSLLSSRLRGAPTLKMKPS